MIKHITGNIVNTKTELLINAANATGWMGGFMGRFILRNGVAETIHYADNRIEKMAKKEAKKQNVHCGDVFLTSSGNLQYPKGILHAVTMQKPGQLSNIIIIKNCLHNILRFCNEHHVKTATIPLLGAGTGRVKKEDVILLYERVLTKSPTLFIIVHKGDVDI